jgi:hypothetical protein
VTGGITPRQRWALLLLSASSYAYWLSGAGSRLSAEETTPLSASTSIGFRVRTEPYVASIIKRDPFAGAPTIAREPQAPVASDAVDLKVPDLGDPDAVTAAELARAAPPSADPGGLVLRATMTGAHPLAYVGVGTLMQIVGIGDTIAGRRVAAIELGVIRFADGSRLELPGESGPIRPPAARRPRSITLTLADLQRLLNPPRTRAASQPPQATPSPVPTSTYPTPGPLPTVDRRGLPVGVNPTPDPSAPTPFPYPYPYAPPNIRQ